jgi:dTDP-4-amino-4,6-dideoxygalactose transaminase
MSWRWQPPVLSPVSPRSLASGLAAACGFTQPDDESVITALRQRYDASEAVLTDSGTSALVLALRAVAPFGGTVAYPGYACIDLTAAAVRAGVKIRLYDLDPRTLSPDLESLRDVMARGVDAVVVAHLYGYPADIRAVQRLAAADGIPVIEDSAQGAGGTLGGARLGSLADISILSFGRGKGTTTGAGGALLVRTPALAEWARNARGALGAAARGGRQVAGLSAQWLLAHPLLYRLPASIPGLKLGEMVYHAAGEPRRITLAAAAILPAALALDDHEIACRRAHALDLLSRMKGSARWEPIRAVAGGESGYLRLALIDRAGDATPRAALGALRGYPLTVKQHEPLTPNLVAGEKAGKGSVFLRDRLFTAPTHSRVRSEDLARLAEWLSPRSRKSKSPLSVSLEHQ